MELDRILTWAGRRSLRELTAAIPAVARILPLLLLTVLLVFFTTELWQLSANMNHRQMVWLCTFLLIMLIVIIVPAVIDMLDEQDTEDDSEHLLQATPFCGVEPSRSKFSIGEWINLTVVAAAVQLTQAAIFIVATFAIFTIFGKIALTPQLIKTWTGKDPRAMQWVGVNLPLDAAMFRVCLIRAAISRPGTATARPCAPAANSRTVGATSSPRHGDAPTQERMDRGISPVAARLSPQSDGLSMRRKRCHISSLPAMSNTLQAEAGQSLKPSTQAPASFAVDYSRYLSQTASKPPQGSPPSIVDRPRHAETPEARRAPTGRDLTRGGYLVDADAPAVDHGDVVERCLSDVDLHVRNLLAETARRPDPGR